MAFDIKINKSIMGNRNLVLGGNSERIKQYVESDEVAVEATDNNQHIEKMFPASYDVEISLSELDPAPDDWNYFKLPDEETFKLIMKSIYYQGQLSPALVWKKEDRYMILGGHTRFAALKILSELYPDEPRFLRMKCHVYEASQLDEAAAKFIIITNNMTQRATEAPSLMIKSVIRAVELQKQIKKETWGEVKGRSVETVAKALGVGVKTVSRYYKLRCLIPEFVNLLDTGVISQSLALNLANISDELQQHILRNGYYAIKDERLKNILKSISVDEIELHANSEKKYTFNGQPMSYEIPKEFKKFSLAVNKEDEETLRIAIMDAVDKAEFKDERSKSILMDLLNM